MVAGGQVDRPGVAHREAAPGRGVRPLGREAVGRVVVVVGRGVELPAGGDVLLLESAAPAEPADSEGATGTILFATSTLYCVPTALADGGPALGTMGLPAEEVEARARKAGFSTVIEVPVVNPMNALYVLRP